MDEFYESIPLAILLGILLGMFIEVTSSPPRRRRGRNMSKADREVLRRQMRLQNELCDWTTFEARNNNMIKAERIYKVIERHKSRFRAA